MLIIRSIRISSGDLVNEVLVFAGLAIAGYLSRILFEAVGVKKVHEVLVKYLVNIIYYILMPLSFATIFLKRGLMLLDLYIVVYFTLYMATTFVLLRRILKRDYMPMFLVSSFPNSVFLGFPVCYVLLGRVNIAAVFGVLTVALNVIVPDIIMSRKAPLRSLLSSTAFTGFIIGVLGHYMFRDLAEPFYNTMNRSVPLLSYVATYVMGLRIPVNVVEASASKSAVIMAGACRFVLAPLLALATSMSTGMSVVDRVELVIVSMMPPAVMNTVVAEKYKWKPETVALLVALLTVIFLVIVFPALYFVKHLFH